MITQNRQTQTKLIHEILDERPNLEAGQIKKLMVERHKIAPSWPVISQARTTHVPQRKVAPAAVDVEVPPPPPVVEDEAEVEFEEEESVFVPEPLLQTISNISTVTREAGGFIKALNVAAAVEAAGGVDNFRRAIELLKRIQVPTNPQVAENMTRGTQETLN